jgi:hypothetical protein
MRFIALDRGIGLEGIAINMLFHLGPHAGMKIRCDPFLLQRALLECNAENIVTAFEWPQ